jgi:hypothetical protein
MDNIFTCHKCPHGLGGDKPRGGTRISCLKDPQQRTIQELAKSGECPEKRFSLPQFNNTVQPVISQINIKKGVIGLSKWLLRLDRATAKLSLSRLKVCKTCEYNTNGSLPRCKLCGCALLAKTKLQSEKCPAGKW